MGVVAPGSTYVQPLKLEQRCCCEQRKGLPELGSQKPGFREVQTEACVCQQFLENLAF